MPVLVAVKTHVAAPASTLEDLQRNQFEKSRMLFSECTEPVGTGLGAVYVECGGQSWPKKCCLTQTYTQRKSFKAPYLRMRSDLGGFFFLEKPRKKGGARFARLTVL